MPMEQSDASSGVGRLALCRNGSPLNGFCSSFPSESTALWRPQPGPERYREEPAGQLLCKPGKKSLNRLHFTARKQAKPLSG